MNGATCSKHLPQGACYCRHGMGESDLRSLCLISGRPHVYGNPQGPLFPKAVKASTGLTKWDLAMTQASGTVVLG